MDITAVERLGGTYTKDGKRYRIRGEGTQAEIQAEAEAQGYTLDPLSPLETAKLARKRYLAQERYNAEIGGIDVGGIPVRTDRETRSILTAGRVRADADPTWQFSDWKLSGGNFATLDAPTVIAIDNAVTAHVQACFTTERTLCDAVDAATTIEEVNAVVWALA